MKMRNFMKKSSLALLLAVLVLLTCILVGTAITASAEDTATEPEYEATIYRSNGTVWDYGDFEDLVNRSAVAGFGQSATGMKLELHKDIELTAAVNIQCITTFEGNGHTIYISEDLNVSSTNYFFQVSHKGLTVFQNINFVGQSKAWWDGGKKVEEMKAFGVAGGTYGAIWLSDGGRQFEMQNCTMTAFRTLGQAACIYYNAVNSTHRSEYSADGLYLIDTAIVGNYAVGNTAGKNSAAIQLPSVAGVFGNRLHVSGNTIVKDNDDSAGSPANVNLYVYHGASTNDATNACSALVVKADFTGLVDIIYGGWGTKNICSGHVFFEGESYATANKQGVVTVNEAANYYSLQGTETYRNFVAGDDTTPFGCFVTPYATYATNWSTLTDTTVKLSVMDAGGKTEGFSYNVSLKNGDLLPTWATWTDSRYGTASIIHANGADYIGVIKADTARVFASKDNGTTWEIYDKLTSDVLLDPYTHVEVLGNYKLSLSSGNAIYFGRDSAKTVRKDSNVVLDFNGFTVTRATEYIHFEAEATTETAQNLTITVKNANFDGGLSDATTGYGLFYVANGNKSTVNVTIEDCTFKDFNISSSEKQSNYLLDGYSNSVICVMNRSDLTLKNVKMENCVGPRAAVYAYSSNEAAGAAIYLEGGTTIVKGTETGGNGNVISIYTTYSALGVSDTFTGSVAVLTNTTGDNKPVYGNTKNSPSEVVTARCYVAEGAEIKGKISSTDNIYFAYNKNGTLCWMSPGGTLDTTNVVPLSYDEETNTLSGAAWYYNDGEKDVATTVAVTGQYVYFIKEVDADAVINGGSLVYGDLKTVLEAAAAGQTVEILRDVTGVKDITISNAITVDGNGKTLTWAVASGDETGEHFMIKSTNSTVGVVYKDIVFHGGAAEKGVWEKSLAPVNATMLPHKGATFDGCTITGARIEYNAASGENGAIFGTGWKLDLVNTTVTDNIIMHSYTGATHSTMPHLMVQWSDANRTKLSGKIVLKENYRIVSVTNDDTTTTTVYQDNLNGRTARLLLGELAAGSEVHTVAAQSFTPELNNGKPYNNSGYLWADNFTTPMTATTENGAITISGDSSYQSYLHFTGTQIDQLAENQISIGSDKFAAQGSITSDKFQLYYISSIKADYYGTDVVIKLNGEEVSRKNLSEYTPADSVFTLDDVPVGMAQLTDEIVIELQNKDKEVLDSISTTAKEYADGLIAATEGVSQEQKTAVASLLQYGAMLQTYFGYHTDELAMTADDLTAWTNAGIIIANVATSSIDTSGETVHATAEGTVPAGITVGGARLTTENQMSLRLYFSLGEGKSLTDYSFTINGVSATPEEAGSRYYIEASHIGTADLAENVAFAITGGGTTYTVYASPMTYVLAVTNDTNSNDNLKNVCEALYYYYSAVAECFPTQVTDTTGFVIAGTQLVNGGTNTDGEYGTPYGVSVSE